MHIAPSCVAAAANKDCQETAQGFSAAACCSNLPAANLCQQPVSLHSESSYHPAYQYLTPTTKFCISVFLACIPSPPPPRNISHPQHFSGEDNFSEICVTPNRPQGQALKLKDRILRRRQFVTAKIHWKKTSRFSELIPYSCQSVN